MKSVNNVDKIIIKKTIHQSKIIFRLTIKAKSKIILYGSNTQMFKRLKLS